ncbi:PRTRC system protein C [Burkholderia sp. BCC1630]|uniref:PRTRC system protein C n=1 Tax=Burkholderia sp. BCC1630 TaxID=2676304 RepID=UPI001589B42E|nr:PRTRC system protein C [Burkholderia sp. BCC1630]
MQIETLAREFSYNGAKLADPAPTFTLQQVRDFYSQTYPELTNAEIEGPVVKGNRNVYTFRRAVGTKGNTFPTKNVLTVRTFEIGYRSFCDAGKVGILIPPDDKEPPNARAQIDALLALDDALPPHLRSYLTELDRFSTAHVCPLFDEEVALINALHARYCPQPK